MNEIEKRQHKVIIGCFHSYFSMSFVFIHARTFSFDSFELFCWQNQEICFHMLSFAFQKKKENKKLNTFSVPEWTQIRNIWSVVFNLVVTLFRCNELKFSVEFRSTFDSNSSTLYTSLSLYFPISFFFSLSHFLSLYTIFSIVNSNEFNLVSVIFFLARCWFFNFPDA